MNKTDKNRAVSSIEHDDKHAAIPDSAHQGKEQMAISGQPEGQPKDSRKNKDNQQVPKAALAPIHRLSRVNKNNLG
jgi:hypothetical protein